MNAKQAREFYLEYLDVIYHQRRVEELDRFYTQDVVAHPPLPGKEPGLAGVKSAVRDWLQGFPDMRIELEGFVYDGDVVAPRITITATHTGPFMGMPATGKQIRISDHPHYRLKEGKFAEFWDQPDTLTMMQQLGVVPALSAA